MDPSSGPDAGSDAPSRADFRGGPPPAVTRRPTELKRSGVLRERNGLHVVLLSFFTCGVYYLYWLYVTDRELAEALADPEIKPGQDLLLTIVTCGIWSVYVEYRNAQKIHAALLSRDPYAKDQSEAVLLLDLAAFVVGATWLVATYILQEELNKLARY